MKKIMFSDRFGLTKAVLESQKTMTRRIVPEKLLLDAMEYGGGDIGKRNRYLTEKAPYKVGEVVAIARSYRDAGFSSGTFHPDAEHGGFDGRFDAQKGWNNKMYVNADFMPDRIRIKKINVERLQDITEEDCMREGIQKLNVGNPYTFLFGYYRNGRRVSFINARSAFSSLISEISGKGTWYLNPWVFVFEFELRNKED